MIIYLNIYKRALVLTCTSCPTAKEDEQHVICNLAVAEKMVSDRMIPEQKNQDTTVQGQRVLEQMVPTPKREKKWSWARHHSYGRSGI